MSNFFPLIFLPIALVVYGIGLLLGSTIAGFGFRIGWDFAGRRNRAQPPPQN